MGSIHSKLIQSQRLLFWHKICRILLLLLVDRMGVKEPKCYYQFSHSCEIFKKSINNLGPQFFISEIIILLIALPNSETHVITT